MIVHQRRWLVLSVETALFLRWAGFCHPRYGERFVSIGQPEARG